MSSGVPVLFVRIPARQHVARVAESSAALLRLRGGPDRGRAGGEGRGEAS